MEEKNKKRIRKIMLPKPKSETKKKLVPKTRNPMTPTQRLRYEKFKMKVAEKYKKKREK